MDFDPSDYDGLNQGDYTNSSKPAFMIDGPSTSLISQMVIYSNSKEIERIQEYDTLGNLLVDLGGIDGDTRAQKGYEGYKRS